MIAIDTNVLVRVLVNDPKAEEQCQFARNLIVTNKDVWVCRDNVFIKRTKPCHFIQAMPKHFI